MIKMNDSMEKILLAHGFNQKFLNTKTGSSVAHALFIIGAQTGFMTDDVIDEEEEEITDSSIDIKD